MLTQAELNWLMEGTSEWLQESVIQRVFSAVHPFEWCLQCRRPGESAYLTLCTQTQAARLHFSPSKPKQPMTPSGFTMLMRKWLQGMVIREVDAPPHERLIRLRGDVRDPAWTPPEASDEETRPDRVHVELVCELLGRHANLFLLDHTGRIMGQASSDRLPGRALKPGLPYAPPAPSDETPSTARFIQDGLELMEKHAHTAAWFDEHLESSRKKALITRLSARIKRHRKKLARLVKNLEGDLARVERSHTLKRYGELLQSAYGKVKRGASSVRVSDYYEDGMPEVEIPLDPKRDLQQNIDKYFKQYKRLADASDRIETRLLETMERLEEVSTWEQELASHVMESRPGWEDLEETLAQRGILGAPKQRPVERTRDGQIKRLPYRCFTGSKGSKIFVGKGSKGNDMVSLKVARGRDIWMHARDWAGAHVVLRMDRGSTPHQVEMLEAAMLAAHYSKGREDTRVEVTHTQAKYVRKPKGYPPGRVTVAGGSTILVTLEKPRLDVILATEHQA